MGFKHQVGLFPQNPAKKKKVNLKGPKHCVCVCVCPCACVRFHACFVGKISSAQRPPLAVKLIKRDQSGPQKAIPIY